MGERVQGKRKYIDKGETAQNTQTNEQSMLTITIYSTWQNMSKRPTTFMPSIVRWGWQWMPKVDMGK